MASIKLCIVLSRPNNDGKFTIRYQITNLTSVTYISSKYTVDRLQWNGSQVIRHPQAAMMNAKLFQQLNEYIKTLEILDPPREMKASEIRRHLLDGPVPNITLSDYNKRYIERLRNNGQSSYATTFNNCMRNVIKCLGESIRLKDISIVSLEKIQKQLFNQGLSISTISSCLRYLRILLNSAVNENFVEYRIFPFAKFKIPPIKIRDICISKSELYRLRATEFTGTSAKRFNVARDMFLLSFYCAGINLPDLLDARLDGDTLTFIRKKTANKFINGDKRISITIQPEARAIIDKYIGADNKLHTGYNHSTAKNQNVLITVALGKIGKMLNFEKKFMYYSARKTFVQFGMELGIPLYVLEFAIGQTIKDANNRPIFNYLKVMRRQADMAIRTIIDYSFEPESEDAIPVPAWARRH